MNARQLVTAAMAAAQAETPPPDPGPTLDEIKEMGRVKVLAVIGSGADTDTTPDKWSLLPGREYILAVIGNIQFLYRWADDALLVVRRDGERFQIGSMADLGRLMEADGPRAYVGEVS